MVKPKTLTPAHKKFYKDFGCPEHRLLAGVMDQVQFLFNDPAGACSTCAGIGTARRVHPTLRVPDPKRTLNEGVFAGAHDELTSSEHISDVIDVDQSPIGRSSCSNPATYLGFYDAIRTLFAETEEAKKRGFTAS